MNATTLKTNAIKALSTAAKALLAILDRTLFAVVWVLLAAGTGIAQAFYAMAGAMTGQRNVPNPQVKGTNPLSGWYVKRRDSANRFATRHYSIRGWNFSINYLNGPRLVILMTVGMVFGFALFLVMLIPLMAMTMRMPRR